MAIERPVLIINQLAGEDLSVAANLDGAGGSGQFLIATQNTAKDANTVVVCDDSKRPRGIIQNNPKSGDAAAVLVYGESKVIAGDVLAAGDPFGSDADGRAIPLNEAGTGGDVGSYVMGEVIEGAPVAGEVATVLLTGVYRIST